MMDVIRRTVVSGVQRAHAALYAHPHDVYPSRLAHLRLRFHNLLELVVQERGAMVVCVCVCACVRACVRACVCV